MTDGTVVVVLAPSSESRDAACRAAAVLGCKMIDPMRLLGDDHTNLDAEHSVCLTSEVALAAARYGKVVVSGPISKWGKKDLLVPKLRKMLSTRRLFLVVMSEEPPLLDHPFLADAHVVGITDLPALKLPPIAPTNVLMCNQIRIIYRHDTQPAKHETVFYDAEAAQPISLTSLTALEETVVAELVCVEGAFGCSLILLPPRRFDGELRMGQHITLCPGRSAHGKSRAPATMRLVAKSLERGDSVCCISEGDALDLTLLTRESVSLSVIGWAVDAHAPKRA